jgi:hypothetical protein
MLARLARYLQPAYEAGVAKNAARELGDPYARVIAQHTPEALQGIDRVNLQPGFRAEVTPGVTQYDRRTPSFAGFQPAEPGYTADITIDPFVPRGPGASPLAEQMGLTYDDATLNKFKFKSPLNIMGHEIRHGRDEFTGMTNRRSYTEDFGERLANIHGNVSRMRTQGWPKDDIRDFMYSRLGQGNPDNAFVDDSLRMLRSSILLPALAGNEDPNAPIRP